MRRFSKLWRNMMSRARVERELDDELRAVFELLVEEKLRTGLRPKAARRAAWLELAGIESIKEGVRDVRAGAFIDGLIRDVRHGVRLLARGRLLTAVVVVTLALGIGVNTAIFTLVNGLLLRPFPYPEADRLVWIATAVATSDNLEEWRAGLRTFERFAAFGMRSTLLTGRGPAEQLSGMVVTAEYLPLLGARPVLGRLWTANEQRPGGPPTVVVGERLWERLNSDGADIGTVDITLDGVNHTVIGVLPASFENLHYDEDVWFPAGAAEGERFNIIGLRRPEATVAAVQAEAGALAERVEDPGARPGRRFANTQTLTQVYKGDVRTPLLVLLGAAGFVLLIACVNVANLLLSRAAGREQEMAVRSALGAGRATLIRQLLVESAVLALSGAVAGWIVATAGLQIVLAITPESFSFGRAAGVRMDRTVFAFALLIAVLTTFLAGLAPALHGARAAARAASPAIRASATRGVRRAREAFIVLEVALALVLLIGTGLMMRTFMILRPASPGFETRDRMVATISLPRVPAPDDAGIAEFARRLLEATAAAAPSARIALASHVPMSGLIATANVIEIDGRPYEPTDRRSSYVDWVSATPNYFNVVGMRVVRGRGLAASDVPGSVAVVVVNESMAGRYWRDNDPIGRRIVFEVGERRVELMVAGIAADVRSGGVNTSSRATAFVSFWQWPWYPIRLVAHQPGPAGPAGLTAEILRRIVTSIDPGVPVGSITTLEQIVSRAVATPRYHMTLIATFGALAVLLALVGCYGVLSHSVAQRTREIGIRIALGASRGAIIRSVVVRGGALIALGLTIGIALALAVTRVLEGNLFGVTPTDPTTFVAACSALALASLAAAYLAASRAARIQPIEALRAE